MSEKSSTSVYIGAPEEFAEWIGYTVDELLSGAAETASDSDQLDVEKSEPQTDESSGFLSRLFGT